MNCKMREIKNRSTDLYCCSERRLKETFAAHKTKDMGNLSKAAAFCRGMKEKEEEYDHCCKMITDLEPVLSSQ